MVEAESAPSIRAMPRTDRASRVIDAPVARVFNALVDRDALQTWLPPGEMTARFERFDPTPGGSYRMVLTYADPTDSRGESSADSDIVEAKRGWHLPTTAQLERYADRVTLHGGELLVTLSDCSPTYARYELPAEVKGVPVRHLSWSNIKNRLRAAKSAAGGAEGLWLGELDDYLRKAVRVQDTASSWAYCVSLSTLRPGGGERTFMDSSSKRTPTSTPSAGAVAGPPTPQTSSRSGGATRSNKCAA